MRDERIITAAILTTGEKSDGQFLQELVEKSKTYCITIKSNEHEEQAKKRYKIEAKNSEIKNPHGYASVKAAGLLGMEIQGATTIFAVNLKRILKLLNEIE